MDRKLRYHVRETWDSYDTSCMAASAWLSAIGECLTVLDHDFSPTWDNYTPGAAKGFSGLSSFLAETQPDYETIVVASMLSSGVTLKDTLLQAGDVLDKFINLYTPKE